MEPTLIKGFWNIWVFQQLRREVKIQCLRRVLCSHQHSDAAKQIKTPPSCCSCVQRSLSGTHGRGPHNVGTWGALREFSGGLGIFGRPCVWVPLVWGPLQDSLTMLLCRKRVSRRLLRFRVSGRRDVGVAILK